MTAIDYSPQKAKKDFRSELTALGIDHKSAERTFPSWGEDAFEHPSGVFELKGYIAKHFGLRFGSGGKLVPGPLPNACFKNRCNTDGDDVFAARALVTSIAGIVAASTRTPWAGEVPSAALLRKNILQTAYPHRVGFSDLLDSCWKLGIPVLYLPELPTKGKKMEGMVTFIEGRPVIIITKRCTHPSWALFILAHELGHIEARHLPMEEGGTLVDDSVNEDRADDDQELAANRFALELLTGSPAGVRLPVGFARFPNQVADRAMRFGVEHGIDPGHLLLGWAKIINTPSTWQTAAAALKRIYERTTEDYCRDTLAQHVDREEIPRDSTEFLRNIGVLSA